MTDPIRELIRHRLLRAGEALDEARVLGQAHHWNACVNRLYYACFYAVSALLLTQGTSSSRHTGIRGLFNRHFVKTGLVPRELARIYNDLFERRQEADYADFVVFEDVQVQPWIASATRFVGQISRLVEDSST